MNNKKKWIRFRHRVVRNVAYAALYAYSRWRYGITVRRFKEQGDRAYLILFNHQTAFDQFFVGMSFRGPVYYVASEDLFSNGWVSSLIRWAVAPIPIKKQTTDVAAVMNCIRVAKAGGTIAMAPEGNRTYSGKTEYMNPAVAALARKLKLPIALYRIEGGYGVHPRWSDEVRKGKMRSGVCEVIEPEEYAPMTNEELLARIETGLYVNECRVDGEYHSQKRAEYLERALYVCPFCGLSRFESHGNEIECLQCHRTVTYGTDKRLAGVGFEFPFAFVGEWYEYQNDVVRKLDTMAYTDKPLYTDTANVSEVIVYKKKILLQSEATIALYGDKIVVGDNEDNRQIFPFNEVTAVSVLGRNKLNVYHKDRIYQFKGDKRFNALKYVNIYYRYQNISKGETDGQFLGL